MLIQDAFSLQILILLQSIQINFTTYCVSRAPYTIYPCSRSSFSDNISAIVKVDIPNMNITGWCEFQSTSNPALTDSEQAYAVGYAEGRLFQHLIWNHRNNVKDWFLFDYLTKYPNYPPQLLEYFRENLEWMRAEPIIHRYDRFWSEVGNTMEHFEGMVLGYQQVAPLNEYLSELDLYIYVSSGDLLDVVNFALPQLRPDFTNKTTKAHRRIVDNHCTGCVRLTNNSIFTAQTAWFFYGTMTRVHKQYTFNYSNSYAHQVTFSSYPGFSYSFDDWYATDSGLTYIETTNDIYNTTLYELCGPETVLAWVRSQVAGRISKSGQDFAQFMRRYNSGTYNNQWIVVDNSAFERNESEGIVWLLEQIPGAVSVRDITDVVQKQGYFPSYNVPWFEEVYAISGYTAEDEIDNYTGNPRANIFRRDAPAVENLTQMMTMMRYNNWTADPLCQANGHKDPGDSISSRYDLRVKPNNIMAFGGFDSKIASFNRSSKQFTHRYISGPTTSGGLSPWVFNGSIFCPRRGLPDGPYNYSWQEGVLVKGW